MIIKVKLHKKLHNKIIDIPSHVHVAEAHVCKRITPKALDCKYIILFQLKVVYATISKLCYDVIVCILYSPMLCILSCLLLKIYLICNANNVIHHTGIQCVYDNRRYHILCILTRQTKRELKINVRHTQDRVELSGWGVRNMSHQVFSPLHLRHGSMYILSEDLHGYNVHVFLQLIVRYQSLDLLQK